MSNTEHETNIASDWFHEKISEAKARFLIHQQDLSWSNVLCYLGEFESKKGSNK